MYDPSQTPATNYFQDLASVKYVVVCSFYVVTTCVGDGFMVGDFRVDFLVLRTHHVPDIPALDSMGAQH